MSKPIKAVVVISNLMHGGAERQVVELSNRIDPKEVDLHVCTLSSNTPLAEFMKNPEKLHVIQKNSKFDLTVVFRLAKYLRENKFDAAHGFLFDAEIATFLAGKLAGTTAVLGSERNSNNNYGNMKTRIYSYLSVFMDVCVANSNAGAAFSRNKFNIPEQKYRVIHNGVDIDRFCPRQSVVTKESLGIPEDACVVGMVGSFKRQKNHPLLLEAAAKLKDLDRDFRLVLVGSMIKEGNEPTAEYYRFVQSEVDRLGLREKVVFVEARNDVEEMFNLSDFTVLPSLFEGTPNVALESLACGVPVIATDVADNKSVIPDSQVGYIVPLGEPDILAERLAALINDEALRSEMSVNARQWVEEKFGLDKMAGNFQKLYQSLVRQ